MLSPFANATLLIVRLISSALMLHHGIEKLADIEGFTQYIIDNYFSFLPFNHSYWTYLAAYTQIVGSFLLAIGVFTRISAVGLSSTMLFALFFHFSDSGLQGAPLGIVENHNYEYEASLLYLLIYVMLLVIGTGKYSVINLLRHKIPNTVMWWFA